MTELLEEVFRQKNIEEFLIFLDQLPIPLIILNKELTIVYGNLAANKLYGYHEGLIELHFKTLLAAETYPNSTKEIFELDTHVTKNKNIVYVGIKYNECLFGSVTCYLLQINDISEVKKHQLKIKNLLSETHELSEAILKTQTELVQQEHRLKSLINSQLNFLIRTNSIGHITFANESFCLLFDVDSDSSLKFEELIIEEDQMIWNNAIDNCLKTLDRLSPVTLRMKRPNNAIVFIEWELYSIELPENGEIELQAVGNDITEKKDAESNLQRTLTLFTSVFNQSSDALFLVSNDTSQIIDCNDTALSMFEFDHKNDMIGKVGYEFEVNSLDDETQNSLNEKLKTDTIDREVKYKSNKGKYFWGNLVAKIIPFLDERVTIVKITDITEKKIKEKEINDLLKNTLVFNQKLTAKNEELNKVNKELDSFVYRVSHDLRAPIASSMGLISIAKIEKEHKQIIEYLDLMGQSMSKLDEFIKDILDYSRNNRTQVEHKEVDLHSLINSILAQNKFAISEKKISIINEIIEGTVIQSDQSRLFVVLSNLISNSIRYSNNYIDRPYIKITLTKSSNQYFITVNDNGIGIPEKYQHNIFDMFFRVSNTGRNGSGIGLYIVKESLLKLNGDITLHSIEGKGSKFTISLPLKQVKHNK